MSPPSLRNNLFFVGTGTGTDDYNSSQVLRIHSWLMFLMRQYHLSSCNGLLCVSEPLFLSPVCICNPFTGNYIKLPLASRSTIDEVAHGFGYHPRTKEYKVVRMVKSFTYDYNILRYHYNVQVFALGTSCRRIGERPPRRLDWGPSEALFNGALHWVSTSQKSLSSPRIVSFDLADEEFRLIPSPTCGSLDSCDFHLAVLGGCFSAVVNQDDGQVDIWVMKEYNVKESWSKDIIIGSNLLNGLYPMRNVRAHSRLWKKLPPSKGAIHVLCILKNGDVLLEYGSGSLLTYNPENEELKELVIPGLPEWFYAIVHVEILFPVETIL